MAATIIDPAEDIQEPTDPVPAEEGAMTTDEVVQSFSEPDTTEPQPAPEDDLPEKYRGKSIKDVVAMHQEAEKFISTQGGEVGELRKVVDTYINSQLDNQKQAPKEPEEEIDFFEDPEKAVSRAIETHPEVVKARQASQAMQQQTALTALQQKHPDMAEILGHQGFAQFVQGSPIRMELFQRADKNYDYNAADELISLFKERNVSVQQTVETETAARQTAIKQASTGSASGASNTGSKRVYRRADIIKLMKEDPDRYDQLSGEITQAYQEGRVK